MRIKSDFVTNSSSTCYIISFKDNELQDFKKFLEYFKYAIDVKDIDNIDDVIHEVGITDKEEIEACKREINNDKILMEVIVSDELGYGLIECTKFRHSIVTTSG